MYVANMPAGSFQMLMHYHIKFMSVVMHYEILNETLTDNKIILIYAIQKIFLSYTSENFSASRVALEMRSLRSGLNLAMSFTKPNKTSV